KLLLLAGIFDAEVDLVLLLWLTLLLLFFFALLFRCLILRLLAGLAHLLPQLLERRDLVGLLLHVEVVDLLFGQIDDLTRRLIHRRLAVAFDRRGSDDPFPRRLPAAHVEHLAEP